MVIKPIEHTKEYLRQQVLPLLVVGAKIKLGPLYAKENGYEPGEILTLVEGCFEHDNGLYTETQSAPSVQNIGDGEYDSIYHLFGNNLEDWMDCMVID